jgi:nicotinate phosphoribosyltransferase
MNGPFPITPVVRATEFPHGAVFTDLYELTMMQGYFAAGRRSEVAAFELFFRRIPEGGGYCIAAGIEDALAVVSNLSFRAEHIDYLASLGFFRDDFLEYLGTLRFTGVIRTVPEGSLAFANEPLVTVVAPIMEAQWLETLLLNFVNFQTLIATKASRIVRTAKPATVVEFGLRRAQGPNGGLFASKAAYLAGCIGTSNVEAGFRYGIPVYGTHAHSWVQSFETEQDSFRAYSRAFPDHTIFLIDTYHTIENGLPAAIAEAKRLEATGHRARGVRIDSGDLAYLAKACRHALDGAGLSYMKVFASSDIDEYIIQDLKAQNAPIDIYGVGTRLATAFGEPALGGVYKLVAVRPAEQWIPKMKISSNPAKSTIPGRKQIWRWESNGQYLGDCLSFEDEPPPNRMRHPVVDYQQTALDSRELRPLLTTRLHGGQLVDPPTPLEEIRVRVEDELNKLPPEHQRLANPHIYRVGLSDRLWGYRREMIERLTQSR